MARKPSQERMAMIRMASSFGSSWRGLAGATAAIVLLCGAGGTAAPPVDGAVVDQVRLATWLADYGDRQRDAVALVAAARIQSALGVRASTARVAGGAAERGAANSLAPSALLARAERYAAGRSDLLALIEEQHQASGRGAVRGPFVERALAPVGVGQRLLVTFARGAAAVFGIVADEDAELDFDVVDQQGKLLCRAVRRGKTRQCTWVPDTTGEVQVNVRNRGASANEYTFFHN
jgi:hypothetical protein